MRELKREVEQAGLQLTDTSKTGSGHCKLIVKGEHGEAKLVFALTPSDRRNNLNDRKILRQVADGRWPGLKHKEKS